MDEAEVDQLCELSGALERELARKTINDVAALAESESMRPWNPFYLGGWSMACEEIMARLEIAWGERENPPQPQNGGSK